MPGSTKLPSRVEQAEARAAWDEYLEACRLAGDRYETVEVWAWDRLRARLREAAARRVDHQASAR